VRGLVRAARPRTVWMLVGMMCVVIAALVALAVPAPASAAGEPIVGDWLLGGHVVGISENGGVYTETAKTRVPVLGASCSVPTGTVLASFQSTGAGTYSGQHGLWYLSNCAFGKWTPMTATLSADGRTLTEALSGYGPEILRRVPTIAFDSVTVVVHSGHSATVRLHCLLLTCQGRITLTGSVVTHVRKRGRLVAVTHTVILGQRTYVLGANQHAAISLVLSASGRGLVRGTSTRHPKHVRLTVTVQGGAASSLAARAV
jgi:hypothetical protein